MWWLLAPLLCSLPILVESATECDDAPPCLGVICPGVTDDCTPATASATLYFYGSERAPLAQVANTTGKLMLNGKAGVADDNMSVQQFGVGCFNIYSNKNQRGECFHLSHNEQITLKDENYRKTKIKSVHYDESCLKKCPNMGSVPSWVIGLTAGLVVLVGVSIFLVFKLKNKCTHQAVPQEA